MGSRSRQFPALLLLTSMWIRCGSGSPKVVSLALNPQTANATAILSRSVLFTATATFDNNSSRQVSANDGLAWSTSAPSIATIDVNGTATCMAVGQVTITATVPSDLNGNGNAAKVIGTAQLNCLPPV